MIFKRLIFAAPLVLAACGNSAEAPTGQVVATVNGEEITTTDLETELNGATAPTPEGQKNLQRAALESIINRTILAQAAESDGLDKGPTAAVLERKARQVALVELLQRQARAAAVAPADEEIDGFIADNPALFSQRKVYVVDQIVVPKADAELVKLLQPVQTLAQAKTVLGQRNVTANETVGVIDSVQTPPQVAKQLASLPPGEVFIIPSNGGLRINQVRSTQNDPITGDMARNVAKEMLARQRLQSSVQASLAKRIQDGRKNVQYNDEFAPPPEATGTPAALPDADATATGAGAMQGAEAMNEAAN